MPPKRKQSAMALLPSKTAHDLHIGAPSTKVRPSIAPRRSGRVVKKPGVGTRPTPPDDSDESPEDLAHSSIEATNDVNAAMHGLQEMEHSLQKAVKRQKLAVNKSIPCNAADKQGEKDVQEAFLPRATKALPDVISSKGKIGAAKMSKQRVTKKRASDGNDVDAASPSSVGDVKAAVKDDGDYVPGDNDAEGHGVEENDIATLKKEGARPPPVNSDYLPLPWKGRLGYACLNTYLRQCNPPVFSSRTCRISSIIEHRHPLSDPSQPEHSTKNRPDKEQPADLVRGQKWVQDLGVANARDIVKMLRWNDKYNIKFMRLSSEMFPFASHEEYGYKLAPFASEVLAEAGKVAAELGHRLTTHPGQFTQLGSPRTEVVRNAIRDLEYHDELLSLLKLPEQQNRDAVMILHMGGVFGDKGATLDRFRQNYAKLSDSIKARLVLENDDVSWTVHDLLPICEELNIPMVLDFHHHNIMFNEDEIREGTKDVMDLFPRIKATWDRKRITQKMHYSEQCSEAVTRRQRRKHRPRVLTLPPCANDMDLMIEAKDKEQAVFELMRTYRLPGWDTFNDLVPYEREDENKRALPKTPKKKQRKTKKTEDMDEDEGDGSEEIMGAPPTVPEAELGMGGPDNRVYWPLGMEEWLRPKKREVKSKKKDEGGKKGGVKEEEE
ncbi:UV-damage endonuclease [Xylariaceae sp. FL0016]|nr:UV-damage endonuclease [Xylariaceae sp. FL0016]